jgi:hypothetical protein
MLSIVAVAVLQADLTRHIYPLAKPLPTPPVVIDVSDFPEGEAWAKQAKALVETWYPTVTSWLATEDFKAPSEIKLVFKKEISAPAYASGGTITVNGKWITQRPDDLGMMIHELVHVVQQYPNSRNKPGWLVEGIADYIRWWRYEPELHSTKGRTKIDVAKAKYTDSYRTTGMWLAWSGRTYHMGLVPALDRAMRKREDPMLVFKALTGKDADELWKEFVAAQQ